MRKGVDPTTGHPRCVPALREERPATQTASTVPTVSSGSVTVPVCGVSIMSFAELGVGAIQEVFYGLITSFAEIPASLLIPPSEQ